MSRSRLAHCLFLAFAVLASDAFAQYGSYRGSKYSGGFGGTAFTSRRQSRYINRGRHTNVYVPGLFNPLSYGVPFGYGGPVYGGVGYGGVGYGGPGFAAPGLAAPGFVGPAAGYDPYNYGTAPGFSPYTYSPYDYQRFGRRTIGVSPGAIYQPGGSFGFTTRRGFGISGSFGRDRLRYQSAGVATFGAYGSPYASSYAGPITPFADPYALPQAPVTPTQSYYTDDADTARRLRQMMRDSDTASLSDAAVTQRAARPVYSDAADKARSVRFEEKGDRHFAAQEPLKAYTDYKDAVDAAGDRAEPRAKLVVTYAAIGQYDRAVGELKTLLSIDPTYPRHYLSLDTIYGDNQISKETMKTRVAEWTAGHVADPDRLMLLGAMMYFDGDIDRSRLLFEKASLYDDLAPLVVGFREAATLTVPSNVRPGPADGVIAEGDPIPLPELAEGETLVEPLLPIPDAGPAFEADPAFDDAESFVVPPLPSP